LAAAHRLYSLVLEFAVEISYPSFMALVRMIATSRPDPSPWQEAEDGFSRVEYATTPLKVAEVHDNLDLCQLRTCPDVLCCINQLPAGRINRFF